jgi:3-hydroxyisobutyrate dehydrogenase
MLAGDFAPGFYVEHFVKDLGIVLQESGKMGLSLPGAALAKQLYERLVALGHARSGTQALVLALAQLSGVEWPLRAPAKPRQGQ